MKKLCLILSLLAMLAAMSSALAGGAYPLTLNDHAGRSVTIESAPERIVSGYYISTSAIIALDLDEKLVGIEAKADKRPIYALSRPALLDLPSVGSAKEFDLEGCAALEPDLVILPLKLKNAAETLSELGMSVLLVNPENQELLTGMITVIAEAAGVSERGEALIRFAGETQAMLSEKLSGVIRPSVYLAGNSSLLLTAGDAMYQSGMIRLAGGENVAAALKDSYWAEISYEQLLAWDPECIVIASDANYDELDVLADENLADCRAVRHGRVYKIPGDTEAWDSPVPGGILGSVWLCRALHPEVMSEEECTTLINHFYETFYHFTCIAD